MFFSIKDTLENLRSKAKKGRFRTVTLAHKEIRNLGNRSKNLITIPRQGNPWNSTKLRICQTGKFMEFYGIKEIPDREIHGIRRSQAGKIISNPMQGNPWNSVY